MAVDDLLTREGAVLEDAARREEAELEDSIADDNKLEVEGSLDVEGPAPCAKTADF